MEKAVLERRLDQMRAEGTEFRTGVDAGVDVTAEQLRTDYDAVVLAGGATLGRDLKVPGRELDGIHLAMDYLVPANRVQEGDLETWPISAEGKHVVIIGGGDTGADCLGTAHRQGALSVTQLEIMPEPPATRAASTPWPGWPLMFRTSSAHEEGGERVFSVSTQRFVGDDGRVDALELVEVDAQFQPVPGTERLIPAQLVLLAMGFTGPQTEGLLTDLGVEIDARGNVVRDDAWATTVPGVFVAGDMGRGQSLIVWAIAEGRAAAAAVDAYLSTGTALPAPIVPTARGL
jgi:glutamate synthase (NADPH/NADH) small chain